MRKEMKYEEINIGDAVSSKEEITWFRLIDADQLSRDKNILHNNPDYAKEHGFKESVVMGLVPLGKITGLIGNDLPGDGALITKINLNFIEPLYVGDSIVIQATVIEKHDETRIIKLQIDVNRDEDLVIAGSIWVKCLE